jgi:hypothetical protein
MEVGPKYQQHVCGDSTGEDFPDHDKFYERNMNRALWRSAHDKSVVDRMVGPSKEDDDEVFGDWKEKK